jgi:hypothetical protein
VVAPDNSPANMTQTFPSLDFRALGFVFITRCHTKFNVPWVLLVWEIYGELAFSFLMDHQSVATRPIALLILVCILSDNRSTHCKRRLERLLLT